MNKIKYIKISKNIKIRYLTNNLKKNPYIIFLHGFMSDIDGEKPKVFSKFCSKLKLGFLLLNILDMENQQVNLLREILLSGVIKSTFS